MVQLNKLYNKDIMEFLREVSDNSVDLIISDFTL